MAALAVGFCIGWWWAEVHHEKQLAHLIAVRLGDSKYGSGFYQAQVYLEPLSSGFSVRAHVLIGRNPNYFHDCGELGHAATVADAAQRWGHLEWAEDGLRIGSGTNRYFLPRAQLENHR